MIPPETEKSCVSVGLFPFLLLDSYEFHWLARLVEFQSYALILGV